MFQNWNLGKKIGLGFVVVLTLTLIVGLVGYFALDRVMNGIALYKNINQVQSIFSEARIYTDQYQFYSYEEGRGTQESAKEKAFQYLDNCIEATMAIDEKLVFRFSDSIWSRLRKKSRTTKTFLINM